MPPLGRSDFLFLNSSSFSSKENEIENLKCTAGNLHPVVDNRKNHDDDTTGFVVNKTSSSPLQAKLQDLTAKADNVTLKIRQNETHATPILLRRIIEESIQKMVMSTIDQVANHNLLVEEKHPDGSCDDNILKKQVLRAVVSDSISNSLYNLDKLEDFALGRLQKVDVNKIDLRLQELLLEGGQQPQQQIDSIEYLCPRVIISSRSNCPSFEFAAGECNSKFHKEGSSSLYVTTTPFIFIRSNTLSSASDDDQYVNKSGSNATQKSSVVTTSKYNVKIGRCSHTVLFKSTSSGCIVGEAKVEIHITPTSNNSSSASCNEKGLYSCNKTKEDDSTPRRPPKVLDVRACQMNVTPRKIQNKLDLYSSSKYGDEDLTLMVKMRTSQALNSSPHQEQDDANPMVMDVQVVLEP